MKKREPDTGQKYTLTKFIGRMGPFSNAHKDIIDIALDRSEYVGLDIGSCFQPRVERTPFTFDERATMIRAAFPSNVQDRLLITPIMDSPYNNTEWQEAIQTSTLRALEDIGAPSKPSIALIGHKKDFGTSFYLDMFPQYSSIGVENLHDNLSATTLRDHLFDHKRWNGDLNHFVPSSTAAFLRDFSRGAAFEELLAEVDYYREYRRAHEDAAKLIEERLGYKTDIKHQTVDAMVLCAGHILLIERKNLPGRGLMALPGGFLDSGEWLDDAFIRELREETKIKVPSPVIRGSVFGDMIADYPYRSMRGRVISRVYGIKLPDGPLPEVKGRSDAKRAVWVPLAEVRPENMFEDHYHIIQHLKGRLKTAA